MPSYLFTIGCVTILIVSWAILVYFVARALKDL